MRPLTGRKELDAVLFRAALFAMHHRYGRIPLQPAQVFVHPRPGVGQGGLPNRANPPVRDVYWLLVRLNYQLR
jgi:hypothetical protein